MKFKLWAGAFSDDIRGEFISDLRRCHYGPIPKEDNDLLDNWYKMKDELKVYTHWKKWDVYFEIRQSTLVVGTGRMRYKLNDQHSEWTACRFYLKSEQKNYSREIC
jgi:hypothetical protein